MAHPTQGEQTLVSCVGWVWGGVLLLMAVKCQKIAPSADTRCIFHSLLLQKLCSGGQQNSMPAVLPTTTSTTATNKRIYQTCSRWLYGPEQICVVVQ